MTFKPHHNRSTIRLAVLRKSASRQHGATLIEILVAVLILSFGLLGMAALQTRALQGNQSSVQRSQAIMLSHYLMDAMRVDRESAKGGEYNIGFVCGPDGISGSTLAKNNLRDWLGTAETSLGANYLCTVRLRWDDSKAGGLADQTIEVQSKV
jgi:type IV pilus assembly protein PilV